MTPRRYDIVVTDHARQRARQRFPEFKLARIVDEVREAINAGRISPRRPASMLRPSGPSDPHALYVWTEAEDRVYVLHATDERFHVMTTIPPGVRDDE